MSNITFSPDGSYFTVPADDKRICGEQKYMCNEWHSCPVPKAVQDAWGYISAERSGNYWLVRRPLPPLPKAKTQEELDEEAFATAYHKRFPHLPTPGSDEGCARFMWNAALGYARNP